MTWRSSAAILVAGLIVVLVEVVVQSQIDNLRREMRVSEYGSATHE